MAQAMKCDRCGVLYEPYENTNQIKTGTYSIENKCVYNSKAYDLCPDCMNWLQRFLSCKGELEEAE